MGTGEKREGHFAEVGEHLENGITPLRRERARDKKHEGFLTNFEAAGRPLPCPVKYLKIQCRLIWWFSALCQRERLRRPCRAQPS
ncbi:MAG: hypothetical protein N3A66_01255 [Planctomycetota bacterium]|nr:hypothetical protein [Planctomycetota bacterium]